jgi:hypothetical protein
MYGKNRVNKPTENVRLSYFQNGASHKKVCGGMGKKLSGGQGLSFLNNATTKKLGLQEANFAKSTVKPASVETLFFKNRASRKKFKV